MNINQINNLNQNDSTIIDNVKTQYRRLCNNISLNTEPYELIWPFRDINDMSDCISEWDYWEYFIITMFGLLFGGVPEFKIFWPLHNKYEWMDLLLSKNNYILVENLNYSPYLEGIKTKYDRTKFIDWSPLKFLSKWNFTKHFKKEINTYDSDISFNKSQLDFLSISKDYTNNPFVFLHWWPWTGKSSLISEFLLKNAKEGKRILLLSHSNKWVWVTLDKIVDRLEDVKSVLVSSKTHNEIPYSLLPITEFKSTQQRKSSHYSKEINFVKSELDQIYGRYELSPSSLSNKSNFNDDKYSLEQDELWINFFSSSRDDKIKKINEGVLVAWTFWTLWWYINQIKNFDIVVIDEATRMHEEDLIMSLWLAEKQIVFCGDPRQLGNVNRNQEKLSNSFFTTVLDKYKKNNVIKDTPFPYVFLDTNYRSSKNITQIVSKLTYGWKMKPWEYMKDWEVIWYDYSLLDKIWETRNQTSYSNKLEAQLICKKLSQLISKGYKPWDIAIIATYKSQVGLIKSEIKKIKLFRWDQENWLKCVATVDSFQWDERKVILLSLTRSNKYGKIGFLEKEERINVAISRAQEHLYVFGNSQIIKQKGGDFFNNLFSLFEKYGEIIKIKNRWYRLWDAIATDTNEKIWKILEDRNTNFLWVKWINISDSIKTSEQLLELISSKLNLT